MASRKHDPPNVDKQTFQSILRAFESMISATTRRRGLDYFRDGRVSEILVGDRLIEGKVSGSRHKPYVATITRGDDGLVDADCTCPVGYFCKHAYALALATEKQVLQASHSAPIPSPQPTQPAPVAGAFGKTLSEAWTARLGATPSRALLKRLPILERIWEIYLRTGKLYARDLRDLAQKSRYAYYESSPIRDLNMMFEGKAQSPLELFDALALCHLLNDLDLPEDLLEACDYATPRRIFETKLREREVHAWKRAFKEAIATPTVLASDAAKTGPFDIRLTLKPKEWMLQLVDETGAIEPLTKKRRQQLHLETPADGLHALLPGAAQFILPFLEYLRFANRNYPDPTTPEAQRLLNAALRHPSGAGRILNAQGEAVSLSDESIRYQIEKEGEGSDANARLALRQSDGATIAADAMLLPGIPERGIPSAILQGNQLHVAPPLVEHARDWREEVIIPWESVASPEGLSFLKSGRSELPADLREKVISITLAPRLVLKPDDLGLKRLCLTAELEAVDPKGNVVASYQRDSWRHAPVAITSERIPQHDWTQPNEVIAHFLSIEPQYWSHSKNWALQAPASAIEELSEWLRAFPAHTTILLPAELQGLREAPSIAHYDLSVASDTSHQDWFNISAVLKVEDLALTKEEIALLLKAKGRFVLLKGKGWRRLELKEDAETAQIIEQMGLEPTGQPQRYHALQLASLEFDSGAENPPAWTEALKSIEAPQPITLPKVPAKLAPLLRPYQTEGFQFLCHLSLRNFGGILADDMGLGKTIQALAWLLWLQSLKKSRKSFTTLVIAPKSVVDNWLTETAKFDTKLRTLRYTKGITTDEANAVNIVVANYTQLRLDSPFFSALSWDAVILDEGQYIKNPGSQTAKAAYAIRAAHRLVLSGTPVENRLLDLWSLMRFAMPGLLGSQASFNRIYDPKKNPGSAGRIARRVKPFLLRRAKSQVAQDLPPRIEEEIHCELEGEQLKLYQAELKRAQQALLSIQTDRQFDAQRFNILQSLMRMRQICCDPRLVGLDTKPNFVSAKTEALIDLLEPLVAEGNKVLVFSQFVSMLELLQTELASRGIQYLTLTGKTENRQELVARFQKPDTEPVFLLSLKAAGTGLNLTAASYVVLFDPWWNPAVEAQGIDRTHRIGQQSQVIAYRLIAKGTVEEKIRALQREKAEIAASVVREESLASVLDLASLRSLLE